MGQLIKLKQWAESEKGFGFSLSNHQLNRIAKNKETLPPALKQGRQWVIDEDAVFVGSLVKAEISSELCSTALNLVERALYGTETRT